MASITTKSNTNGKSGKGKDKNRSKQAQEASVSQYHLDLSAEYLQLTLYKDALRCANRALELDPKLLLARIRRGIARKNLGLLEAALAVDLDTVLSIDSSYTKARELRDEIYLVKQKDHEESERTPVPTPNPAMTAVSSAENDPGHDENDHNDNDAEDTESTSSSGTDFDSDDDDADIMVNSETPSSSLENHSEVTDYTSPHYNSSPSPPTKTPGPGTQKTGDDLDHFGNRTACRFYNHNGCNRGTACIFSHAPDSKSIRDERGKNICLYHLIGKCKWDNQNCIYSHSRTFLSASVSSTITSSKPSSNTPPPFTISASFAPFSSSAPTRPPDGDPEGWWNHPERVEQVRELVLQRDEKGRLAHEARIATFNARAKNKRSKKGARNSKLSTSTSTSTSTSSVPCRDLDIRLLGSLRTKYYDSDLDDSEYSFDTDVEEESQMEQRYLNGGFTDNEVMELLCQGVKPWDDDADVVLAALSGDWW
ncbi:hypothetical protein VKT23_009169 [Stygiomarasmius scandens]|uniref:C3H1-type domain-containing protein n=1 Tax=Marasmiellus scandens TaxID=2682957 RepID=A0ABR1JF92_9AGAR